MLNDEQITDELHLPSYPKGPTLEIIRHKALARQEILELACDGPLRLQYILYEAETKQTFAIWSPLTQEKA